MSNEWIALIGSVVSAIISGGVAIVVCAIQNKASIAKMNAEYKKEVQEETNAIKCGLQAVLRAQMIHDWNKWSELGYAPLYARENFENCWKQYHSLGANGVMNNIHDKFLALPTIQPRQRKGESK